jgi:uncharacterized RDD family membrane protein YckC
LSKTLTNSPFKETVPDKATIAPVEVKVAGIRWRFLARFVDLFLIIGMIIVLNAIFAGDLSQASDYKGFDGVIASVVWLAFNFFLLVTRGQSVGKLLVGIQIADFHNNKLLGPFRVIILRENLLLPLIVLSFWFPIASTFFTIAACIDLLWGLSDDRRCLHDLVSGSHVIFYDAKRTTKYGGDQIDPKRSLRVTRTHSETSWELKQIEKRISCLRDLVDNDKRSEFAATKIRTVGMTPVEYFEKTLQAIMAFMENNPDATSKKTAQEMLNGVKQLGGEISQLSQTGSE